MKFSIATALAFASAVFAQGPTDGFNAIIKPTQDEEVAAGSTYKIEWQYNDAFPGSVSIDLLGGTEPKTLAVVDAIAGETFFSQHVPAAERSSFANYHRTKQRASIPRLSRTSGRSPRTSPTRPTAS